MASTRKRSARIAALQKEDDAPEVEKPSTSTSKQSEVEGKRSPKTVASKRKQIKKEAATTSALVVSSARVSKFLISIFNDSTFYYLI